MDKYIIISPNDNNLIQIISPGPKGPQGEIGPSGSTYIGNLATTGSNVFIGDQIITGSLVATDGNFIPTSGSRTLTGNLNITSSTNNISIYNRHDSGIFQIRALPSSSDYSSANFDIQQSTIANTIILRTSLNVNTNKDATSIQLASTNNNGFIDIFNRNSSGGIISRILLNNSGLTISLGSDMTGDIYYRNSSGRFIRLPIGSDGQILKVIGGLPVWGDP